MDRGIEEGGGKKPCCQERGVYLLIGEEEARERGGERQRRSNGEVEGKGRGRAEERGRRGGEGGRG